jgi:hypothetical protein
MLEKLFKKISIFSFLFTVFTAAANNFTHQNVDKASEIFDEMVTYYGGVEAINNIDNILADYDYSTNYRTQGYGYQDTDYHSNRPGNTLSLISFKNKINWTQTQSQYMKSFYSYTNFLQEQTRFNYNDITRTYTTSTQDNFDKHIERQLLKNPLLIIKSILAHRDGLRYLGDKTYDGKSYAILSMILPTGKVITTYVDQNNYQITKIEFLRKGALNEYSYSEYQRVGQFQLPFFIKMNMAEHYYSSYFYYHVASYDFSPNVEKLAIVPKDYALAENDDTYDGELRMQNIGKGLYWATRSGSNTIFIEFSDHVMVVDANGFNLPSRVKKFRELVPNKPIKYVSISHHHHDHFDQVPHYAEQGTKIITAKSFIPLITKRVNEVYDDGSIKPIFEVVNKKRIYADETQRVEIYELKNMLHAETMLMTYFPTDQLIYLPDHYEVGYLIENKHPIGLLMAEIERLGLKVKGFISGHGNKVYSLAAIEAVLAHPIEMNGLKRQPDKSVIPI